MIRTQGVKIRRRSGALAPVSGRGFGEPPASKSKNSLSGSTAEAGMHPTLKSL